MDGFYLFCRIFFLLSFLAFFSLLALYALFYTLIMNTKTLPGIIEIYFLPVDELVLYPKQIITPGASISAIGNWTKLAGLISMVSCIVDSEITENGMIYNTTIEGLVMDEGQTELLHRLANKYHAFKLVDVYKAQYLIGTDKKPAPELKFTSTNEGVESGVRAVSFQITWVSTIPPTPLVLL